MEDLEAPKILTILFLSLSPLTILTLLEETPKNFARAFNNSLFALPPTGEERTSTIIEPFSIPAGHFSRCELGFTKTRIKTPPEHSSITLVSVKFETTNTIMDDKHAKFLLNFNDKLS